MRRYGAPLWLVILLTLTVVFAARQRDELGQIGTLLRNAGVEWVVALILLEAAALFLISRTYQALLRQLGHTVRLLSLIGIHLQRIVVGTVTPVGGPASVCVFIHALHRRGIPAPDGLLTVSISSVIGMVAFVVLLIPVLLTQPASWLLLASSAALLVLVFSMVGGLTVLLRRDRPRWLVRLVPRRALRFVATIRSHDIQARALLGPVIYLLTTKLIGVVSLAAALRAVGHEAGLQVALIGYVVGMIFLLVAPVFNGIGVVEVSMVVTLERLGVPAPAAIGATLLYRAVELWLPLAVGVLLQATGTVRRSTARDKVRRRARQTAPRPQLAPVARPAARGRSIG